MQYLNSIGFQRSTEALVITTTYKKIRISAQIIQLGKALSTHSFCANIFFLMQRRTFTLANSDFLPSFLIFKWINMDLQISFELWWLHVQIHSGFLATFFRSDFATVFFLSWRTGPKKDLIQVYSFPCPGLLWRSLISWPCSLPLYFLLIWHKKLNYDLITYQ